MTADQIRSLQPALAALLVDFRSCFKKETTFLHWQRYLLGLMADLKRKSIEPIALAAGVPVRTLQEFLSQFVWDHARVEKMLQHRVMDTHDGDVAIGVIDGSGHAKKGGETGKRDNCIVGQHLLYTDNDPTNPFITNPYAPYGEHGQDEEAHGRKGHEHQENRSDWSASHADLPPFFVRSSSAYTASLSRRCRWTLICILHRPLSPITLPPARANCR